MPNARLVGFALFAGLLFSAGALPAATAEKTPEQIPNCILILLPTEGWRFGLDHVLTFATRQIDGCGMIQGIEVLTDTDPLCVVCDWLFVGSILHCIPRPPNNVICQPLPIVAQEYASRLG